MADRSTPLDEYVLPRVRYRTRAGVVTIAALALVAGVVAIAFGWGYRVDPTLPLGVPWMPYVVVVGAAACLLVKRAMPIAAVAVAGAIVVLDVAAVTGSLSLVPVLAFFDAIYATMLGARARIRRIVLAVAIAVGLALGVVWLTSGDADPVDGLQLAVSLGMLIAAPAVLGTSVRQRDELLDAETVRADAVARAAEAERESAVRGERAAMARELHDELAARLSAIALQSAALAARAPTDDPTATAVRAIRASSVEALDELRQLIGVLTTGRDDAVAVGIDDVAALRRDAERFAVDLDARVDVPAGSVATAASHALMRIAREALVNAARHAPGESVRLRAGVADGVVTLEASNALVPGVAAADGNGLGMALMAQRWRAVGGSGSVGEQDGRWVVWVEVPSEVDA